MNRELVSDALWEALAECDLIGHVTNDETVALLRHYLLTIRNEITRTPLRVATGVEYCDKVVREEAGTLATSGPSESTPASTAGGPL